MGLVLVSCGPNPERSLYQCCGLICTWGCPGAEDLHLLMTINLLSGCAVVTQRRDLRQGRIQLDLGERLSAY